MLAALIIFGLSDQTALAQSCVAAPAGLVGWWPMDGVATDIIDGNDPTATSLLSFPSGKVGKGVKITASGGFVDIPDSANLANQNFTIDAWVRPDGPGPNLDSLGSQIVSKGRRRPIGNTEVSVAVLWSSSDGRFRFLFGGISKELIISDGTFPADGSFYHVAATYDGNTFSLYVDGKLEGSHAQPKTIVYDATTWTIGSNPAVFRDARFPRTFDGVIDEVEIFDRALTADEILAIINADSAGKCKLVGHDHYLSYDIKKPKGEEAFDKIDVILDDQFQWGMFTVEKRVHLLTPVDRSTEGISDPDTHLVGYKVKRVIVGRKPPKIPVSIEISNQFGSLSLEIDDINKADRLLVPASKKLEGPASPLGDHGVNHFLCYKVKLRVGEMFLPILGVRLVDQFEDKLYDVVKPKRLCNPTEKHHNGDWVGDKDDENHLVCYELEHRVFVKDQFGEAQVETRDKRELCVPSIKKF